MKLKKQIMNTFKKMFKTLNAILRQLLEIVMKNSKRIVKMSYNCTESC